MCRCTRTFPTLCQCGASRGMEPGARSRAPCAPALPWGNAFPRPRTTIIIKIIKSGRWETPPALLRAGCNSLNSFHPPEAPAQNALPVSLPGWCLSARLGGVQGGSRSGGNFSPVISNFPSSPRGRGITKGQRIRPRKIKHPRKSRRGNAARRAASPTSACPRGEGSRGKLRTVSSAPGFDPFAFCIIPYYRSNLPPPGPVRPGLPGASPQLSRAASLSLRRFPPHTRC